MKQPSDWQGEVTGPRELIHRIWSRPPWLLRMLYSADPHAYCSLGMRSARARSHRRAAYRMVAGTSVGQAILSSETRSYTTGHLIGRCRDMAGNPAILGASISRAKVWMQGCAQSLLEFKRWCFWLSTLARGAADIGVTAGPRHSAEVSLS
jgi:hypothetical protein